MRICKHCKQSFSLDNFYKCGKYYQSYCKKCSVFLNSKWAKNNRNKTNRYIVNWRKKYHNTPQIKAQQILDRMKTRSRNKGFDKPEFTKQEIQKILINGKCIITGKKFEFSQTKFSKSPWTPTPDRIDSSKGYTKLNTQWVCFIYNAMKSDFDSDVIEEFTNLLYASACRKKEGKF